MTRSISSGGKRSKIRGSELIEFTMVLVPLFSILFVLIDISWAIFAKSTLQYAIRAAVRQGVTITGTQATAAGETLTQMVKDTVQANALGLLSGTTGRAYIQVHYLMQDSTSSTGLTDVSTNANGNNAGNIMQVSIVGFPLSPLVARIYTAGSAVDKAPTNLNVSSADAIEPSVDIPPIGVAP
jgi:Flp pilus assembly protein TadG